MNNSASLNLLSPEERLDSSLQWNYIIIKNVILMILTVTFFLSVILFGAKLILKQKLAEAQEQINLINSSQTTANNTISEVNRKIDLLSKAQKKFIPWSAILKAITDTIPAGITIDTLDLSDSDTKVEIRGRANSRDALLLLEDNLKKASFASDVFLPLSNLLQRNDIDFSLTFTLDIPMVLTETEYAENK